MKKDVKTLLEKFDTKPNLKAGDLVLTAEIHRVVEVHEHEVEVVHVFPECRVCKKSGHDECDGHTAIKDLNSKGGQQVLMKLKEETK